MGTSKYRVERIELYHTWLCAKDVRNASESGAGAGRGLRRSSARCTMVVEELLVQLSNMASYA